MKTILIILGILLILLSSVACTPETQYDEGLIRYGDTWVTPEEYERLKQAEEGANPPSLAETSETAQTTEIQPKPAEFVASNLRISEVGREYTITVDVENVGGSESICQVVARYDNEAQDPVDIQLQPGEKKTVSLDYLQTYLRVAATAYQMGKEIDKQHLISVDGLSQTVIFPEAAEPEYKLQCLSWSNYTESGYIQVVGEVKNISDSKLENVTAVVNFRTDDGTLVKTDEGLLDYNPLMPGQTSSFTVMTTENPAIKKLGLGFKYFMGGKIPTEFID